MSTTIDQKVVEMRFDNRQFEEKARATLSTLQRLKESLNFKGASKGLDDINVAASKLNFNPLVGTIDHVGLKFNGMFTIADQALRNMVNSAQAYATRIAKSLTVQPITTGFNEYELKMNSVQTIMASTGESLETVNAYLEELNEYSDKTIYSFSDMTQNIGKFTNAGVKLEDAVMAIKGISNEAAVSGANANEAARAMYNFAQALSAGYVKLIDWKSIENANMATVEFKNELIKTAVECKTLAKASDGMYKVLTSDAAGSKFDQTISATKNFNDSLSHQWMTTDVLVKTLAKYASETTDIGKKASEAATRVKTFTQLMDTLKESAQSGWAKTWEIVFGDFYEGTNLWTAMSKAIGGVLDKMSDARNKFLGNIFDSNWEKLLANIEKSEISIEDFTHEIKTLTKEYDNLDLEALINEHGSLADVIKKGIIPVETIRKAYEKLSKAGKKLTGTTEDMAKSLEEYQKIFDDIWLGNFGNGEARLKALTDAGYNYDAMQSLVNKHAAGYKLTLDDLNEAGLTNVKITEDQVEELDNLRKAADKAGVPVEELINNLTKPSTGDLIFKSISNILTAMKKPLDIVKESFREFFPELDSGKVYDLVAKFESFTEKLNPADSALQNFTNTVRGFFAAISFTSTVTLQWFDMIINIIDKALKAAFENSEFGILALTGRVGEAIVKITQWATKNEVLVSSFTKIYNAIAEVLAKIVTFQLTITAKLMPSADSMANIFINLIKVIELSVLRLGEIVAAIYQLKPIQDFITSVKESFTDLWNTLSSIDGGDGWFKSILNFFAQLKSANIDSLEKSINQLALNIQNFFKTMDGAGDSIGQNIVSGLLKGIFGGLSGIVRLVTQLAELVITTITTLFGIHSPSKVMFAIGSFLILGLINGIDAEAGSLIGTIQETIRNIIAAFTTGIEPFLPVMQTMADKLPAIFAIMTGRGLIKAFNLLGTTIEKLSKPIITFKELLEEFKGIAKAVKETITNLGRDLGKMFVNIGKGFKFKMYAAGIKDLAIAIAILTASIVALAYVADDPKKLWNAVGAIAAIIAMLTTLTLATGWANKAGENKEKFFDLSKQMLALSASLLIVAMTLKVLNGLDPGKSLVNSIILAGLVASLIGIAKLMGGTDIKMTKDIASLLIFVIALRLLVSVLKALDRTNFRNIGQSLVGMLALIGLLKLITMSAADMKFGAAAGMIGAVAGMYLLMKLFQAMGEVDIDIGNVIKGLIGIIGALVVFDQITKIGVNAGANATKAGLSVLGMAAAMYIMVKAIKFLEKVTPSSIAKAVVVIGGLGMVFTTLIMTTEWAGDNAIKAGTMLMMMSAAVLVLTGVIWALKNIPVFDIAKAVGAIAGIGAVFAALIFVTKYAKDAKSTLMILSVMMVALTITMLALTSIPAEELLPAAKALVLVFGAFAAILMATSKLEKGVESFLRTAGTLGALTLVVAALGVVIWAMSKYIKDQNGLLTSVSALSALLLAMSGAMVIITHAKTIRKSSFINFAGALTAMVIVTAALAGIIALLSKVPIDGNILYAVGAISALLLALSVAFTIISHSKTITKAKLNGVTQTILYMTGALAVIGLLIALIAAVKVTPDIMYAAGAISTILVAMAAACTIISYAGPMAMAAMPALWQMLATVGVMALVMAAIGALANEYEWVEKSLDTGIRLTKKIGELAGSLISGFAEGLTSGLPGIGTNLKEFAENAEPFFTILGNLKGDAVDGITRLTGAISTLTESAISDGWYEWWTGKSAIGEFGVQMTEFVESLSAFADEAVKLDTTKLDAIDKVTAAATGLAELANTVPAINGLTTIWSGDNSLSGFGRQLIPFAKDLIKFTNILAGTEDIPAFTDEKAALITSAATGMQAMADFANNIPEMGGAKAAFAGDNTMSGFAKELVTFAQDLVTFSNTLSGTEDAAGITEADITNIKNLAPVITALAEVADVIPNTGGIFKEFIGDNDMATFGRQLSLFGYYFQDYANYVRDVNPDIVEKTASAAKALASLAKDLPSSGGIFDWLFGDNDISTFGQQLATLGKGLAAYSESVSGVNTEQLAGATKQLKSLAGIAESVEGVSFTSFGNFGIALGRLAETGLTSFAEVFSNSDSTVTKSISSMVSGVISTIRGKLGEFKTKGEEAIGKFKSGIEEKEESVKTASKNVAGNSADAIETKQEDFIDAGEFLGDGLVIGISSKMQAAYDAGYALGQAAVQGEKDGQQSQSPSKATEQAGIWLGEGLVNGIVKMGAAVYRTGSTMGSKAVDSISNALKSINDADTLDVRPSIRPVLDLSGMGSGEFNLNTSLNTSLIKPVDSLSRIVHSAQAEINRSNEEVISAVNGLRDDLNNLFTADEKEIALYVDSKKLASSLAKNMNRQLNILSRREAY